MRYLAEYMLSWGWKCGPFAAKIFFWLLVAMYFLAYTPYITDISSKFHLKSYIFL